MTDLLETTLHQTRRAVVTDLQVAVTDLSGAWFPARLQQPERVARENGSPRSGPVWLLLWEEHGPGGPNPSLSPGDRVTTTDDEVWEVLSPTTLLNGSCVADALKVSDLYPETASITDQGGSPYASTPVAVFSAGDERVEDRGRYQDLSGEVPPEMFDLVDPVNTVLDVDGRRLRITSASLRTDQPRVLLSLRTLG